MKVSLCVHSYDEAEALTRLVQSSLPLADMIHEWVIVDHRSDDRTADAVEALAPTLEDHGIGLVFDREERDFQPGFLFADLRQETTERASGDILAMLDADYILGPAYRRVLKRAIHALQPPTSRYYGVAFSRPVVWDHLTTDENGVITSHGRVWIHAIHKGRVEIMRRGSYRYQQKRKGGAWETPFPTGKATRPYRLTKKRSLIGIENAILSANIKPEERLDLRQTMTYYQREVVQGRTKKPWLEAYEADEVPRMGEYSYHDVDLRGWKTNLPNLDLRP